MAKVYRKKYYNTATGLTGTTPDMAAEYARRAAHQQSRLNMDQSRMEQIAAQHAAGLESQERIQGTFDARSQHAERMMEAQNRFLENQAKLKQKAEQAMQAGKQNFAVKMQQMAHQQGVEAAKLKYQLENEQYEARNPVLGFQREVLGRATDALPSSFDPERTQDVARQYLNNMLGLTPPDAGPSNKDKIKGGQAKQKIEEGDEKGAREELEDIDDPDLKAAIEADLGNLTPAKAAELKLKTAQERIGTYKKPKDEFTTALNEIESDFESATSLFADWGYEDQETELGNLWYKIVDHSARIAKRTNLDTGEVMRYLYLRLAEKHPEWRPYLEKMASDDYENAYSKRPSSWLDTAKNASPAYLAAKKVWGLFQD